jgi:uncharacterized protein YdgA (DUF945 family)
MRALKWFLSITISLALILGVALPFVIGLWIQKAYPKIYTAASNASGVPMSVESYHRGIYSSTATVAIHFNSGKDAHPVLLEQKIQHGPLIFDKGPHLALALITSQSNDSNFKSNSRSIFHLNKELASTLQMENVDVINGPIHFSMQNFNLNLNFWLASTALKSEASIAKLTFEMAPPTSFSLSLTNAVGTQELARHNHIWFGSRKLIIDEISMSNSQGNIAEIHNLIANVLIAEAGDKTQATLNYQAKNSRILNSPFDSLSLALSISNLDTQVLSTTMQNQAKKNDPTPRSSLDLTTTLMKLAAKGGLIQLNHLVLKGPEGDTNADGKINIPALNSGNIFQLIAALKLDFNVKIPKTTLISMLTALHQKDKNSPEQRVDQWIAQKVLIPSTNGLLTMKVQFENAKLLVNGVEQGK